MKLLRLFAAVCLAFIAGPAPAQNNSLAEVVTYAKDTGRVVIDVWGDSTGERNGGGHAYGMAGAMYQLGGAAGVLLPPNHSSDNNETQGFYEARRASNGNTYYGVLRSGDISASGWPAADKQYGFTVPTSRLTGTSSTVSDGGDGLTNAQTTIVLASGTGFTDPAGTSVAWIIIDSELISYTDRSTNTLTGCVRAVASTADAHAEGATVSEVFLWQGPTPAYLGGTLLNGAIDNAVTTITVDSTAAFPAATATATQRIRIDNEIISYTGKTATTFTGCTRAQLSTTAASHSDNAGVYAALNGSSINGIVYNDNPLGVCATHIISTFWVATDASVISTATMTPRLASQATAINTDTTNYTNIVTGSAFNFANLTVGTVNHSATSGSQADRGTVSIFFGPSSASNGLGPFGPAAIMYNGIFASARPTGFVQAMGISRGGQTLSALHYQLNKYDTAVSQNEFYNGLVTRYKAYIDVGDADLGGNGAAALLHGAAFGHNECGGGGHRGMPNTAYPWTIHTTAALAEDLDTTETTITLADTTGLDAGTIGSVVRIDDEYVLFTGVSGADLTGCVRGVFGSVPAVHSNAGAVYQGYLQTNPKGFASTLLFDYSYHKAAWVAAGGTAATFHYVWPRPIPVSGSPAYIDNDTIPTTMAQREARMIEYSAIVRQNLTGLQNFYVVDFGTIISGGETTSYQLGASSSDVVHNEKSFYRAAWQRAAAYYVYGLGAGNDAVGGGVMRTTPRGRGR